MISLIIPVYNIEQYLRECLDSIVVQTCRDFEAILIDDGSTDSSGEICDEYAKKNANFIVTHQKNAGVSSARNKGLELANGEYIVFVDSDDYLESTFLDIISREMGSYDLLFYGDTYHYQDGNIRTHQPFPSESSDRKSVEDRILAFKRSDDGYEYFGYTWNKVFRIDIIKKHSIRFIEGLSLREDEIFTAEYCRYINTLKVISSPVYHYHVLNSGLSSKPKSSETIETYCDALKKISIGWTTRDLLECELDRYVSFLFQAYHSATTMQTKWRIAHKIRNEYRSTQNSQLKPSRFFMLSLFAFRVCLIMKFLLGR